MTVIQNTVGCCVYYNSVVPNHSWMPTTLSEGSGETEMERAELQSYRGRTMFAEAQANMGAGKMGTVRGGDMCVDHLHHSAGLTGRLMMASDGTGTLNPTTC